MKQIFDAVNRIFEEADFTGQPANLYAPIAYTMRLGGKRLRPAMLIAANQMFGGDIETVREAAIGIEMFHNFTLLHDDLMDHSPIRRGEPTVYRKWNENTAILSGDTMLLMAYKHILATQHPQMQQIIDCFNETALGVCAGQQLDMDFETCDDVTLDEYIEMIQLKTAVLIAGALKIGALYAHAPSDSTKKLYDYGIELGIAFQLQDDLLDAFGDVAAFGKKPGQDIIDNKKTYLYLKALQVADRQQRALLDTQYHTHPDDPQTKIEKVIGLYRQLDIKTMVESEINQRTQRALEILHGIEIDEAKKKPLEMFTVQLIGRQK